MVWIDCEMTGLDPKSDRILEIAVLITNGNLDIVDEQGICYIIKTEKEVLDNMNEWCIKQHGLSGLTAQCLASQHTHATVKQAVLDYIKSWIPNKGVGVLAGSSVHADRGFLVEEMPELVDHLHYRVVDVSSIKELCRRWYPGASHRRTENRNLESNHRALDDIRGSIQELKWYREHIFVPAEQNSPVAMGQDGQRF